MHQLQIKWIYEAAVAKDGYLMLVDHLWPRGIKKEHFKLDEWNIDLPSFDDMRKWFDCEGKNISHGNWKEDLCRIRAIAKHSNLTILYGAKDLHINHAIVLLKVLLKMKRRRN